jgi:hypothetical protein
VRGSSLLKLVFGFTTINLLERKGALEYVFSDSIRR